MMRRSIGFITLALTAFTVAGENGLGFVYQPLIDQGGIRIERVPAILGHASPV